MEQVDTVIDTAPLESRRRRSVAYWINLVLVAVIVAMFALPQLFVGGWSFLPARHQAVPFIVEGWANPNFHGTAIGLSRERNGEGEGYIIAGAHWRAPGGIWNDGSGEGPTCVGTDTSTMTRVRMGVVRVRATEEMYGFDKVIWIDCLSEPE